MVALFLGLESLRRLEYTDGRSYQEKGGEKRDSRVRVL